MTYSFLSYWFVKQFVPSGRRKWTDTRSSISDSTTLPLDMELVCKDIKAIFLPLNWTDTFDAAALSIKVNCRLPNKAKGKFFTST